MQKKYNFILTFLITLFILTLLTIKATYNISRNELLKPTRVIVEKGMSFIQIAQKLEEIKIVKSRYLFLFGAFIHGKAKTLKAGEYEFPAYSTCKDVVDILASGEVVIRKITFPEGLTSYEIVDILNNADGFKGDLVYKIPDEGSLFPSTYTYYYGDDRNQIVHRMKKLMREKIDELWLQRPPNFILENINEFVNLASIVEKETYINDEKPLIAGVFLNRLKKGMKLQADPTILYALTQGGKKPMERLLTRKDLKLETPYNSYYVYGLPPTPICNPGLSSLKSVIFAKKTDYLYFVVNGQGGHNFSNNLNTHNLNYQNWVNLRDKNKKQLKDKKINVTN